MERKRCKEPSVRNGIQKHGTQRYYCKKCKSSFQSSYKYRGLRAKQNVWISQLLKEGVGIRGIVRLVKLAPSTGNVPKE
jgi:transposase-like protein